MKCLEKDRTRRYETANGLAADLERHLANEPVVARPPSTAIGFKMALRRNKAGLRRRRIDCRGARWPPRASAPGRLSGPIALAKAAALAKATPGRIRSDL